MRKYKVGDTVRIKENPADGNSYYKEHKTFLEKNNYVGVITDVDTDRNWYRLGEFDGRWTEDDILKVVKSVEINKSTNHINTRFEILDL